MAQQGESSTNRHGAESRSRTRQQPDVVVLDTLFQDDEERKENLKEDLWLSTVDGRYGSMPVPIRVGQSDKLQTFYVHEDVLFKSAWFRTALQGNFKEAANRSIDLPEEDPAIFHHLVAFLYEGRYVPIKCAATELDSEPEKGKAVEESSSDSDSSVASWASRSSARSRLNQERRRRQRERVETERAHLREKHPNQHRYNCRCSRCHQVEGPRCWDCGALPADRPYPYTMNNRRRRYFEPERVPPRPMDEFEKTDEFAGRIKGQDLRTWLMTYELNIDVYICAERYLVDDFKTAVMQHTIDMLETVGTDAAQVEVLRLCGKLYKNVPETDALLKMVLSRVGFLQPLLWKSSPTETSSFLVEHPEVAAMMLRETVARQQFGAEKPGLLPMVVQEATKKRRTELPRRRMVYPTI